MKKTIIGYIYRMGQHGGFLQNKRVQKYLDPDIRYESGGEIYLPNNGSFAEGKQIPLQK